MIITSPDAWEWARFIHIHQPIVEMCSGGISGCWNVYERASSLKITSVAVHLAFKRFVGARSGRKGVLNEEILDIVTVADKTIKTAK